VALSDVEGQESDRMASGMSELDRVLGGGFVPGGAVLLGGDPGIGKSTLALQVAAVLSQRDRQVLYVTGEESLGQLKLRADRIDQQAAAIDAVCETNLERVENFVREGELDLLVIDSIQTIGTEDLNSSPGSVTQLKEVTSSLTQLGKGLNIPIMLIGHVTKEGAIAGPKVLEHMVDTVLYFEGRSGMDQRVLRGVKNRYGSTNEIGVFRMGNGGLEQVLNPSAAFLEERPSKAPGSAVVPVVEGTRPLLVEVQGLVSQSEYGPPQVTAVGTDKNRVILLLNIIEKRTGLEVAGHDVFVNVIGGMRIEEPAADLAVAVSVLSSYLNRAVPEETCIFGEVGLTGEVRAVSRPAARLKEAEKLGFSRVVMPAGNEEQLESFEGDTPPFDDGRIDMVHTLADAIRSLFGDDVLT
jgi:DNA repair protein RadA/Sms